MILRKNTFRFYNQRPLSDLPEQPVDFMPPAGAPPSAAEGAPEPGTQPSAGRPAAGQTVGVFDSGVGGFTVAQAILALRPDLNLVYFGDSLNLPYGQKSAAQLQRRDVLVLVR